MFAVFDALRRERDGQFPNDQPSGQRTLKLELPGSVK
jgi:hypothetical protein